MAELALRPHILQSTSDVSEGLQGKSALNLALGLTWLRYTLKMPYRRIGARISSDSKALKPLACVWACGTTLRGERSSG